MAEVRLSPDEMEQLAQRVAEIIEQRATNGAKRWLTVAEAAEHIGCDRQRIYDLRTKGALSRSGDGRRVLVDREELDRLVGPDRRRSL
jgi:excisionase family DNA binding protein